MFRTTFTLILLAATISNLHAQDASADEILTKWKNAAQYTINLIDSMPAEHFDFRPTPEIRMFKEQIVHIVDNMTWLSSSYLGAKEFDAKKPMTKNEHMEYMRAGCEYAGKAMAIALRDSSLMNTKKDFFAGPMNGRQIIRLMHDHMTHHRGQLIIYLRLKGVKPPKYFGW